MALALAVGLLISLILLYAIAGALLNRRDNESVDRTAKRAGDRLERATGGILTVGRVVLVTSFSITMMLASEGAVFFGEMLAVMAEAPMAVGQVIIGILGYIAATGGIRPVVFAALATVTIVLAVGVATND